MFQLAASTVATVSVDAEQQVLAPPALILSVDRRGCPFFIFHIFHPASGKDRRRRFVAPSGENRQYGVLCQVTVSWECCEEPGRLRFPHRPRTVGGIDASV